MSDAPDNALAALLAQYGVDPASVAGVQQDMPTPFSSGPQADTKIYTGTKSTPASKTRVTDNKGKPILGGLEDTYTPAKTEKQYSSLEAKLGEFYNMTPQQRAEIQRQLFVGGMYGKSVNAEDISWGTPDETSYQAWTTAVARTALLNQAGQDVTVEDVLGQAAATGVGLERSKNASSGPRVVVSDPASLALLANDVAQKVLGRKANQDEQRAIIAAVQSQQASFSTGGSAMSPDPTSTAEAMLRDTNAVEAGAHDYAGTMDTFLGMLGGIK